MQATQAGGHAGRHISTVQLGQGKTSTLHQFPSLSSRSFPHQGTVIAPSQVGHVARPVMGL